MRTLQAILIVLAVNSVKAQQDSIDDETDALIMIMNGTEDRLVDISEADMTYHIVGTVGQVGP